MPLSTAEGQLLLLLLVSGQRLWSGRVERRQWGESSCRLAAQGLHCYSHQLHFLWPGVTWQLRAKAPRGFLLPHWQAPPRSNTTQREYSLFPWHHPARNGGRRGGTAGGHGGTICCRLIVSAASLRKWSPCVSRSSSWVVAISGRLTLGHLGLGKSSIWSTICFYGNRMQQ